MSLSAALYYSNYWTDNSDRYDPIQFESSIRSLHNSDLENLRARLQDTFSDLKSSHDRNEISFQRYHSMGKSSLVLLGFAINLGVGLQSLKWYRAKIKKLTNCNKTLQLCALVAFVTYPFLLMAILRCQSLEKNIESFNVKLANSSGMREQVQQIQVSRGIKNMTSGDLQNANSTDLVLV